MESEGWIKLHRQFLNWEWFDSLEMVKLFIFLLLEANHEDGKWHGQTIRRGQILTSFKKLSEETSITERKVRTCLSRMEQTGEIIKKTTQRYTLLTISNYDRYQVNEESVRQTSDTQTTSKRHANDTQTTTNKNDKNERMEEDIISSNELCPTEASDAPEKTDESEKILPDRHCQNVVDFWNRTVAETQSTLPQVLTLSDKRKKKMRIRWKEFSKVGDPVEVCRQVFTKACTSKFCQGDNKTGWSADFDWIFTNGENWVKVYEGNYDNKPSVVGQNKGGQAQGQQQGRVEKALNTFNEVEQWIHGRFDDTAGNGTPDFQGQQ